MNSSKFLLVLGLLLVLSLAVLADTSKEKEGAVVDEGKEVNSVEATDKIDPQQGRYGCRHGCCRYRYGRCVLCCHPRKIAEKQTDAVEPQQRRCGGCRCCGACAFNQCSACC